MLAGNLSKMNWGGREVKHIKEKKGAKKEEIGKRSYIEKVFY